ncbi:nuclear envelope integral membrane protein 1a-like [Porites lutea]|uniref:nuclear envelope integral membrane protein 1a-like n=1 Tax=Porites lutea TaxID=51062 RepID=UPI003CC64F86
MAAHMARKALYVYGAFCILWFAKASNDCENISILDLSRKLEFSKFQAKNMKMCVSGRDVSLSHLWGSVVVALRFEKTDVQSYEADSCHALNPANKTWGSVFQSLVTSTNIQDQITFKQSPFKTSCFAVEFGKKQDVSIEAEFQVIDWKFPAAFLAGLVIFYNAERLSRNSLFFYSSGVSLGLIMSILLLVYILHRLIPGRGGAYAVLIGGWSLGAYLIQWTWSNLKDLLLNHNQWVIGYLVVIGLISFGVCYYYGPVTSDRGLDLIRWMLQLIGLSLLYMSTRSDEVSIALCITVVSSHIIRRSGILIFCFRLLPQHWVSYRIYYFFFPPRHTFLSEEEYMMQGTEETRRALEDLREYCSSPECDTWRLVSRLQNPTRFAQFMSSGQHIVDNEVRTHEEVDPLHWLTEESEDETLNTSSLGE